MNSSLSKRINIAICCIFLLSVVYCQLGEISKTKLYDINGNKYISALEYADAQNIQTFFYKDKEKLELRFQNFKLLISPHSSFIRVNDNIYHMYLPVIYDGNDFFFPANSFLEIINNIGMPSALMDSSEKYILTTAPRYNVLGAKVVNKVNGTVLMIKTNKHFSRDVLSASITRGGWLNITIVGGLIDSLSLAESPLENPVIRIRTVQSEESAQLSFLLKSKVDDFEIEPHENNISFFLRVAIAENAS